MDVFRLGGLPIEVALSYLTVPLGTIHPQPCGDCGSKLKLVYQSKYGVVCYVCINHRDGCKGNAHATLQGTPHGLPVNADIRMKRRIGHIEFEKTFAHFGSKRATYRAIQTYFESDVEIHIGWMTTPEEFEKLAAFCEEYSNDKTNTQDKKGDGHGPDDTQATYGGGVRKVRAIGETVTVVSNDSVESDREMGKLQSQCSYG